MTHTVRKPEVTTIRGRPCVKVYICLPCAEVLKGKKAAAGGVLEFIELAWLCPECRANHEKAGKS